MTGRKGTEALDALKADPALVMQFRQAVMANETELDKAYLADRADARKRDTALAQSGHFFISQQRFHFSQIPVNQVASIVPDICIIISSIGFITFS